jgi:hypothetical protein
VNEKMKKYKVLKKKFKNDTNASPKFKISLIWVNVGFGGSLVEQIFC